MDETIYKIALAGYLHDIGKFAERAHDKNKTAVGNEEKGHGFFPDEKFMNDNMDLYQPHFKDKYTHKHAVYTAAFIDHLEKILPEQFNKGKWGFGDPFMNLAAGHHKPETPMQWIIAMADRISSGFDRQEFEDYNNEIAVRDYKKTRLLTIFEGIDLNDKWKENLDGYDYRYPLKVLAPETIFPVKYTDSKDNLSNEEYSNLFFDFVDSLEKLKHKHNIHIWLEHFDSLFMIYASNIPAATVGRVIPDISLYDHSKITSALASAIYLYHMHNNTLEIGKIRDDYENKKFLIITGDFYGIQDFIFSEGGSTGKAAAKLLRGRSFAVSLISELAADMLCREIGLTISSIVLNAAGKFTIIAPNTESSLKGVKEVEKKINEWLIKNFFGESTFGISYIEASYNDFTIDKFDELMENLSKKTEIRKLTKIDLNKFGGVVENYLDGFNNDLNKKLCPFCGKRPSNKDIENDPFLGGDKNSACNICRDHIYIGTNLVKNDKIAILTKNANIYGEKLKEPIFDRYQLSFDVSGDLNEMANDGSLIKYWNISSAINGNVSKEITAKFINGYTPKYEEEDNKDPRLLAGGKTEKKKLELIDYIKEGYPKTFSHLAKKSLLNKTDKPDKFTGIEALGCLKADVDKLGLIFTCGLQHNNLSRTATMSRQLNYFFSVYLPHILSSHTEFKNIYTVFAGGDDLFLIGPWNRIVDFASFLNDKFREYVCENPDITISAGISVNKPDMPVLSFSETAENALKNSKENSKDSLTLFGESVKWHEFKKLEEIKHKIEEWLKDKFINKSMLFRFNNFIELARQEKKLKVLDKFNMEDIECLQWRAKFKYNLTRNTGNDLNEQERKDAVKKVEESAEWIEKYAGAMKISLWQIIYNQRR